MIRKGDKIIVGNLSKRVKLIAHLPQPDGMGGSTPFKFDVKETWADIVPISANRRLALGGVVENISHQIKLRYRDDLLEALTVDGKINQTLRLQYNSRIFTLNSVINMNERNRTLDVLAVEENFDTAT